MLVHVSIFFLWRPAAGSSGTPPPCTGTAAAAARPGPSRPPLNGLRRQAVAGLPRALAAAGQPHPFRPTVAGCVPTTHSDHRPALPRAATGPAARSVPPLVRATDQRGPNSCSLGPCLPCCPRSPHSWTSRSELQHWSAADPATARTRLLPIRSIGHCANADGGSSLIVEPRAWSIQRPSSRTAAGLAGRLGRR